MRDIGCARVLKGQGGVGDNGRADATREGGIGLLWVLTKESLGVCTVMAFQAEKREQGAASVADMREQGVAFVVNTSERRVAPMAEMREREASITSLIQIDIYTFTPSLTPMGKFITIIHLY